MDDALLHADCSRCVGLCCVALAFDRSSLFAFEKRAGEVCRHLRADCRCGIHEQLELRGLAGCVRYDCLGAGQRVTQQIFGGRTWRQYPELLRPMLDAFRALRLVHELLLLLREAGRLPLTAHQHRLRLRLLEVLHPASGWTSASLADFERGQRPTEARAFFAALKPKPQAAGSFSFDAADGRP
jgi:hypothetical protein